MAGVVNRGGKPEPDAKMLTYSGSKRVNQDYN
jgi:hypothetical protein